MKPRNIKHTIPYAFIVFLLVCVLIPYYLMIVISFKTPEQFLHNFWSFSFPLVTENYIRAWKIINHYIVNSVFVSVIAVVGVILISVLAGYAFAKYRFKGRQVLFMIVMAFNMIPASLMLIPMYLNILRLGMNNSLWGIILTGIATNSIVPIILSRSFFEEIPDSIFESARLDGAREITILAKIVTPMSMPIITTVAIFSFFSIFNDFMLPFLVLSNDQKKTIPIGLAKLSGQFGVEFGMQMAAYAIISIPLMIVISFAMKTFVEGISAGSVKM